ncbi:heavy-metal-associated domain-containing protein [Commensalibacter sp. M0134]|nr:heavy-metal-associated domain-containing protein [Commensalibacter sp. B14384M2]MBI0049309.1 heavy-metal-associated domain-containing protein [Commensalibacter sp. B14384M3]MBI0066167.1 heavy-metal-associated domain-containing protein [Commensalibacter sp. M0134]MBI0070050.1 heavy-metal-associated domain-containing protein [Commensalibacter sp. M0133]MBI0081482.1 heavy-metal-associated domain-containing protein [Commensalibacter melissae]MBI0179367.1 heavy-metal-associated domain-containing
MMKIYHVEGMTCQHCVHAVKEAVEALPDVQEANVDLKTGTLKITGSVNENELKKAIEKEGYTLS